MWKDLFLFDVIEDVDRLFVDRLFVCHYVIFAISLICYGVRVFFCIYF